MPQVENRTLSNVTAEYFSERIDGVSSNNLSDLLRRIADFVDENEVSGVNFLSLQVDQSQKIYINEEGMEEDGLNEIHFDAALVYHSDVK